MSIVIGIALFCAVIYLINRHLFSYWSQRKFPFAEPNFLIGNLNAEILKCNMQLGEFFGNIYKKYKHEKLIGIYLTYRPLLVINDPELIQNIMIKDFTSFHDRPMPVDEKNDPLSGNLFFLCGHKWRDLRVKLTPTFTSGKLKVMFPIMSDCGKVLQKYIDENIKNGNNVFEFKDLMSRFTLNNISSIAFGIDNDCINEPDHIFRKMGLAIFTGGIRTTIVNLMAFLLPKLMVKLKIKFTTRDVEEFMFSIVNQTVAYREKNNYHRNDFMDLMIQLKNNGFISASKNETEDEENKISKISMNELVAQAFVFFAAGFETSSSTSSWCLYELCRNPDAKKKVQDEIDRVMNAADSKELTYELLNEMKYLDCCIDETLRKYPIIPMLNRTATNDYKIPNTNLIIEKGTSVFIPLLGIQRDPDIYDDPLQFKPERFLNSPNGNGKGKGLFYLPFGDGPRICIGFRLGKLQAKLGLVMILSKFNAELNDKSLGEKELTLNAGKISVGPIENIDLRLSLRE